MALCAFNDGSGSKLCAGGAFTSAGGTPVQYVAQWNGSTWAGMGAGVGDYVWALGVVNDGSGPALYSGGDSGANRPAKWNGTSWIPVGGSLGADLGSTSGSGILWFSSICEYDDGHGPRLCLGGNFNRAGGLGINHVARLEGTTWNALGGGIDSPVWAIEVFDDGGGPALFVGGELMGAGGAPAPRIAKWDGAAWSALAGGVNNRVQALRTFDDGSGSALFAGGAFTMAGALPVNHVAKWNGSTWSALGTGADGSVLALTVFDDGTGPALYAGGQFSMVGGVPANNIARWDGNIWSALGTGTSDRVAALAVFDDGGGSALYAAGYFTTAGGVVANRIAKWDGSGWSPLGSGVGGAVKSLVAHDDGSGQALYAGGGFGSAGGISVMSVAKWDGTSWSALGSGLFHDVNALASFDDGGGRALYAGGSFTYGSGLQLNGMAKWDGANWSALGSGIDFDALSPGVLALGSFDDGGGPALYVGGFYYTAIDSGDSFIAKWGNPAGCGTPASVNCEPGVGGTIVCPCGNAPAGSGRGCDNSAATGGAALAAAGIARLAFDSVVLTTSGERPSATSIVLQATGLGPNGTVFGQGVRCVGGSLRRLYVKNASGGSITAPAHADPHVHARSAALGDPILPGSHRYYGVYYRDPIVLGGCSATSTFNITQQLDILWSP
jgi:hypothetical protein